MASTFYTTILLHNFRARILIMRYFVHFFPSMSFLDVPRVISWKIFSFAHIMSYKIVIFAIAVVFPFGSQVISHFLISLSLFWLPLASLVIVEEDSVTIIREMTRLLWGRRVQVSSLCSSTY